MRLVITGATGTIGRPLVERLLGAGHTVEAWSRDPDAARTWLPARCRVADWNPTQPLDPLRLRGLDAVVHLAGEPIAGGRWSTDRRGAIRDSRVAGSAALVAAIAALPCEQRPRALVAASAIGFYGDRGDERLAEDAAPGTGFLADVCRAWEAETLRAAELGVRAVALRIGLVLDPRGGLLRALLPAFRLGLGGPLGSGGQWMSWIHRDDLVDLIERALVAPELAGPVNAVAPSPVTNREFARTLGAVLARPAWLRMPAPLLRLLAGELGVAMLASQRVVPRAAQHWGVRFRHPELHGALVDLCADLDQRLDVEQWVPRPPADVFPFYADAHNLERLTPAFLRFRVVGASDATLREGTLIDYRLRLHGLPVAWRSRIESWQPDASFVDRQVRGPYARWHHRHTFTAHAGGTLVRDQVRYRLPFGALGELLAGRLVARDLARIFAYRSEVVAALFAAPAADQRRAAS